MEIVVKAAAFIAAGFAIGIGTLGPALGQGLIGSRACENLGKYPESASKIRTAMMLALMLVESLGVYALVVSLLLVLVV